jgi:hypothetical protein
MPVVFGQQTRKLDANLIVMVQQIAVGGRRRPRGHFHFFDHRIQVRQYEVIRPYLRPPTVHLLASTGTFKPRTDFKSILEYRLIPSVKTYKTQAREEWEGWDRTVETIDNEEEDDEKMTQLDRCSPFC